jgi:hypothetical protein
MRLRLCQRLRLWLRLRLRLRIRLLRLRLLRLRLRVRLKEHVHMCIFRCSPSQMVLSFRQRVCSRLQLRLCFRFPWRVVLGLRKRSCCHLVLLTRTGDTARDSRVLLALRRL